MKNLLPFIQDCKAQNRKLLAILIDPDKFDEENAAKIISKAEEAADFLLVGGSTVEFFKTEKSIEAIKKHTELPVVLFPGDYNQITEKADALLFLSLLSGRNPEYLIGQHVKSISKLKNSALEVIPTAYLLIEGGKKTAVERVSGTKPLPQSNIPEIVDTALAGEFLGNKILYLEAGSGAKFPVGNKIISQVKKAVGLPVIVGGGLRTREQIEAAYTAGADVVVVGTAFEDGDFSFKKSLQAHLSN